MANDRCSVCNAVSSGEIRSNPEDHVYGSHPMRIDPYDDTRLLCFVCQGVLDEVESEWEDEDDVEDDDLDSYL